MAYRRIRTSPALFARLWCDQSVSKEEIAARTGFSIRSLGGVAKALSLPKRRPGQPKKLLPPEFMAMWSAGVSQEEMARHFGMARPVLGRKAREAGAPPRQKGKSNLTVAQFYLLQTARAEQAQMELAEMVDNRRRTPPRAA
jgi:hypothetical protein